MKRLFFVLAALMLLAPAAFAQTAAENVLKLSGIISRCRLVGQVKVTLDHIMYVC